MEMDKYSKKLNSNDLGFKTSIGWDCGYLKMIKDNTFFQNQGW